MNAPRTGADIVVDVLAEHGVDVVFGYPGGAIMPLYDSLFGHDVRHVLTRHEAGAAFAASGYARSSGRVGVCIATSGPGATNLVTGIADAMLDNVPLIALTGQVKSDLMGTDAFQEVDIASITQSITKRNIVVRSASDIAPALRMAFSVARGPRPGPVLVDLPTNVLKAQAVSAAAPLQGARSTTAAQLCGVERIVEAIQSAKKPMIIIGGGARWSRATAEYRRFCSLVGAPHAATLHGLGCAAPDDLNYLGMVGMHGWTRANRAVAGSDVLIALGMRFDDRVTGNPNLFAPKASCVVHIDIDAAELNKIVPARIAVCADLKEALDALNSRLRCAAIPDFSTWCDQARSFGGNLPCDAAEHGQLSATDVLDVLFELAPAQTIVTTDVGQHQMWAAQRARPCDPSAFISSGGLGSMGFGVPAAIGAQFAHPGRPVVAIVGDGGLQMTISELATLRRYQLPIKILLIDNRNLGMVRQWQQFFYEGRYSATSLWDNPEFSNLAHAYGVQAWTVDSACDLRAEMTRFLGAEGPVLLHAACYPFGNVFPMIPSGSSLDQLIESAPR